MDKKITCEECGMEVRPDNLHRHKKSKKHIEAVKTEEMKFDIRIDKESVEEMFGLTLTNEQWESFIDEQKAEIEERLWMYLTDKEYVDTTDYNECLLDEFIDEHLREEEEEEEDVNWIVGDDPLLIVPPAPSALTRQENPRTNK